MNEKTINFNDKKINKKDFYNDKKQFKIKDIDISKILISKPESYGKMNAKKYITGYNDDVIRPLHIFFPQMNGNFKCFDDNMRMYFLADDTSSGLGKSRKEFFKKYTKLRGKIKDLICKKFDSEPIYNDNYIKAKIKSYNDDIRTNFRDESNNRKVPKEDCSYKCLSLISLDSVIQMGKNFFPQTLLEECKYKLIKKKIKDLITDDFYLSSEPESDDKSFNDKSDGESFNE